MTSAEDSRSTPEAATLHLFLQSLLRYQVDALAFGPSSDREALMQLDSKAQVELSVEIRLSGILRLAGLPAPGGQATNAAGEFDRKDRGGEPAAARDTGIHDKP